jgi:hypothetical protein
LGGKKVITQENYVEKLFELYGKLATFMDSKFGKESILQIGNMLGFENDGTNVILHYNTDIMYLYDYGFFEYSFEGKTLIQLYEEEVTAATEEESEIIKACRNSYISLFRIVNTSTEKKMIFLKDIIGERKNERLICHELSKYTDLDILLFTRILTFDNFKAVSGMMTSFDINKELPLINGLVKSKKEFAETNKEWSMFIYFYTMNKTYNLIG